MDEVCVGPRRSGASSCPLLCLDKKTEHQPGSTFAWSSFSLSAHSRRTQRFQIGCLRVDIYQQAFLQQNSISVTIQIGSKPRVCLNTTSPGDEMDLRFHEVWWCSTAYTLDHAGIHLCICAQWRKGALEIGSIDVAAYVCMCVCVYSECKCFFMSIKGLTQKRQAMRATSSLGGLAEHSVCIQRRCASGHFGCLK